MSDATTDRNARRLYQQALESAMRHAARQVPWDQAFEIAHDVATELVRRSGEPTTEVDAFRVTDALIHRAVANRLRNSWRAGRRRTAVEGVHTEDRTELASAWYEPGTEIEIRELERVIDATIADMPAAMRAIFTLIREQNLPYKEAAARLGVAVGTIHTQLSRANARLRQAIDAYRSGAPTAEELANARAHAAGDIRGRTT